jgi:HAD superfamily hydrolase (TIGR01509 family)
MKQVKAALFDLDGVLVDTEPIYDVFWNSAGVRYHTGIDDFAAVIKGTTLPDIVEKYFSDRPRELVEQLLQESVAYEKEMALPAMPGAIEFVRMLKAKGVRTGLVTSSDRDKTERAVALLHLQTLFDTFVTADRITRGKPDPECYLLAASDLKVEPADCIVFEDSFNGIRSATLAGMRVIGLATTNPAESLLGKVHQVIPGFQGVGYEQYLVWAEN